MTARPHDRATAWARAFGLVTILLAAIAALLPLIDWAPQGGLVGWLLVLAGTAEFAFGIGRRTGALGDAAMVAGLLTAAAGLIFILDPFAGYVPVANIVMGWLLVRGAVILLMASRLPRDPVRTWLALSGAADLLLGIALAVGLSVTMLVLALFGPTREIVAQFSLILSASFLVTGLSQIMIARNRRRASPGIGD